MPRRSWNQSERRLVIGVKLVPAPPDRDQDPEEDVDAEERVDLAHPQEADAHDDNADRHHGPCAEAHDQQARDRLEGPEEDERDGHREGKLRPAPAVFGDDGFEIDPE